MVGLTGRTIEDVLDGHTIVKDNTRPSANPPRWLLDDYQQTFPNKLYAAIVAIAITEAREGKDRLSFSDVKAYALRVIATVGSEEYFRGERRFNALDEEDAKKDFSSQIGEIRAQLANLPFNLSELEKMMALELKELEGKEGNIVGMPLRLAAIEIRLIAKAAMSYLKDRKNAPYLLPTNNGSRTEFYSFGLEGSRN